MSNLEGSKTEKNLLKAFAGESQAKNRYEFFAKKAKKDGYEQISELFSQTALEEQQHAKIFFKYLEGRPVEITATYPAGKIGTTPENLKAAAMGENEEWTELYPEFSKIASEEGFSEISRSFKLISKVEAEHEAKYNKLLKNVEENKVFSKDEKVRWKCRKCGHIHTEANAPGTCPVCDHPTAYFEIEASNY